MEPSTALIRLNFYPPPDECKGRKKKRNRPDTLNIRRGEHSETRDTFREVTVGH